MSSQEILLKAIFESPNSFEALINYGNLLQRKGDPYGEFILTQLALSNNPSLKKRRELLQKEQDLFNLYQTKWLGPLKEFAIDWEFKNGFIQHLEIELESYLANVEFLNQKMPLIEIRFFQEKGNSFDSVALKKLLSSPSLIRLVRLELPYNSRVFTSQEVKLLAECKYLKNLKTLILENFGFESERGIGSEGASLLSASPYLANLEKLVINWGFIENEGLKALTNSNYLTKLKELRLGRNKLDNESLLALKNAPFSKNLETLDLRMNDFSKSVMEEFLNSASLKKVKNLYLDNNLRIDAEKLFSPQWIEKLETLTFGSVEGTPEFSKLKNLKKLKLGNDLLPWRTSEALTAALFPKLISLKFGFLSITSMTLIELINSSGFKQIENLDLSFNSIHQEGALELADSEWLEKLTQLNLAYTDLNVVGLEAIVSSPKISNLTTLDISHSGSFSDFLNDEGLLILAMSPHLVRLQHLTLGDQYCTGKGIALLLNGVFIPRLSFLSLSLADIGEDEIKKLCNKNLFKNLKRLQLKKYTPSGPLNIEYQNQLKTVWGNRVGFQMF